MRDGFGTVKVASPHRRCAMPAPAPQAAEQYIAARRDDRDRPQRIIS